MAIIPIAALAEAPVGMRLFDATGSAVPPPAHAVFVAPTPTPDPPLHIHAPVVMAVAPLLAPQMSPPSPASLFALPSSLLLSLVVAVAPDDRTVGDPASLDVVAPGPRPMDVDAPSLCKRLLVPRGPTHEGFWVVGAPTSRHCPRSVDFRLREWGQLLLVRVPHHKF